jgi:CIC family chloride channel protein
MLGAVVWAIFNSIIPNFQPSVGVFVIVGMMAFFGGVGKVPVAVILMASEMTGTYLLLVPSMIATAIAYVVTGKHTIYKSQLPSRASSPAHKGEYSIPLLQKLYVKDAMSRQVIPISPEATLSNAAELMKKNGIRGLPVVNNNDELVGIITQVDILQIHPDQRPQKTVAAIMTKQVVVTYPDEDLSTVLEKMTGNQIGRLPVVSRINKKTLMGIVTRQDVWRVYRIEVDSRLDEEDKLSGIVEK